MHGRDDATSPPGALPSRRPLAAESRFETRPRAVGGPVDPLDEATRLVARRLMVAQFWLHRCLRAELESCPGVRHRADLEDFEQDIVLSLLKRLSGEIDVMRRRPAWWAPETRFRAYLQGAVRRAVRRSLRDPWWSWREASVMELDEWARDGYDEPGTWQHIVTSMGQGKGLTCVKEIDEANRLLLRKDSLGLTHMELAELMGVSVAAITKRRSRLVSQLKARCADCSVRVKQGCVVTDAWFSSSRTG